MTFEEQLQASRDLTPKELDDLLRSLGRDDRFCAVAAWLDRNREAFMTAGSRQDLASDHGKLAHGQGSVHALNVLIAQLANLLNPAPTQGGMPMPPPESE